MNNQEPNYHRFTEGFKTGSTVSVDEVRDYFFNLHDNMGQEYDGNPYSFHLRLVEYQARKYSHLIDTDADIFCQVMFGVYGHDAIEDCNLTYNNVGKMVGQLGRDIIYACTEEKGRTRDERKPQKFYDELVKVEYGVFVKLCDIIANSLYSQLTGSSMFHKYRSEYYAKVKPNLYPKWGERFEEMFKYLEQIYELNPRP